MNTPVYMVTISTNNNFSVYNVEKDQTVVVGKIVGGWEGLSYKVDDEEIAPTYKTVQMVLMEVTNGILEVVAYDEEQRYVRVFGSANLLRLVKENIPYNEFIVNFVKDLLAASGIRSINGVELI